MIEAARWMSFGALLIAFITLVAVCALAISWATEDWLRGR